MACPDQKVSWGVPANPGTTQAAQVKKNNTVFAFTKFPDRSPNLIATYPAARNSSSQAPVVLQFVLLSRRNSVPNSYKTQESHKTAHRNQESIPSAPGQGVSASIAAPAFSSPKIKALSAAWLEKKAEIFAGKMTKPDAEDPDTVNHLNWYMSTGFKRPYPGEKTVRLPSEFNNPAPSGDLDD